MPATKRRTKKNPYVVKTHTDVANFFGLSLATIQKWSLEGMPGKRGAWPLDEIVRWERERRGGAAEAEPPAEGEEGDEPLLIQRLRAQIEKLKADIEGKNLRNEEARGNLIALDDAEQTLCELCAMIRNRLEAAPDQIELLIPAELRETLKAEIVAYIAQLLKEMSEWSLQQ